MCFLDEYMLNKLKLSEYVFTSQSKNNYVTWEIEDKDNLSKHISYKLCSYVNDVDA